MSRMDLTDDSDSLMDIEEEDDMEDEAEYRYGGYHRVFIGEVFNKKYKVVSKLGWGHFSTVWLVEYTPDPDTVWYGALKVIRSATKYTETARDEIEILRTITENDPQRRFHCLHLIDNFSHRGLNGIHTCLVVDVGGSNLLSLIKLFHYQGIPVPITKTISQQVLVALDFLHTTCQLIHTDLKPENVLLNFTIGTDVRRRADVAGRPVQVLLADFGNANWVFKRYTNDIQTRQYRCPEVMLGLPWDTPVDIWSHACMIFELLTGDFLFAPKNSSIFSKVDDHFAQFIELLGPIPHDMIDNSKLRNRYFTRDYELKRIPNSQLSFWPTNVVLVEKYKFPRDEAERVSSLLEEMLVYDPLKRATARKCLEHEWFASTVN